MKKVWITLIAVLAALALLAWLAVRLLWHFSVNIIAPIPAALPGTVRVACVGDSSTYGMLLWNREQSNYPARLQNRLGAGYSVRNYAANSTTVLATGDHPYTDHRVFQLGTEFNPDIVFIMLGTNDAKPENWTSVEAFAADYRALVSHYLALESAPAVYLMTPPAVLPRDGKVSYNIDLAVLEAICQTIRDTADEWGLPLIDIHSGTAQNTGLLSGIDGVHLNRDGADFVAEQAWRTMTAEDAVEESPH